MRFIKPIKRDSPSGIDIELTGSEIATAIDTYLVANRIHINGSRTIRVNGYLLVNGSVNIDPSATLIVKGKKI